MRKIIVLRLRDDMCQNSGIVHCTQKKRFARLLLCVKFPRNQYFTLIENELLKKESSQNYFLHLHAVKFNIFVLYYYYAYCLLSLNFIFIIRIHQIVQPNEVGISTVVVVSYLATLQVVRVDDSSYYLLMSQLKRTRDEQKTTTRQYKIRTHTNKKKLYPNLFTFVL